MWKNKEEERSMPRITKDGELIGCKREEGGAGSDNASPASHWQCRAWVQVSAGWLRK